MHRNTEPDATHTPTTAELRAELERDLIALQATPDDNLLVHRILRTLSTLWVPRPGVETAASHHGASLAYDMQKTNLSDILSNANSRDRCR